MKIGNKKLFIVICALLSAGIVGFVLGIVTAPADRSPMVPLIQAEPLPVETEAVIETTPPTEPPKPDWNLLLVNPWKTIPDDFDVTLTELPSGHAVDARCYDALQEMLDACRAEGLSPVICSSYRTQKKQQQLYDNKVARVMAQGFDQEEALVEAARVVAVPGTSEHQIGLAVDIVDKRYQVLDEAQEDTAVQKWLMKHSWEYGWILRYPNEKSAETGIIYEPWHYRYVGKEVAEEIYKSGLCLEEYMEANYPNA